MASISDRIKQFNKNRIQEYTAIKYQMMSENAFRFFRGTCHLFYEDLSCANDIEASPLTWISGDLHIENFGSYKGDNRLVYFDLNDFDEAALAPANWEVLRFVTSLFIAFDSLQIKNEDTLAIAKLFLNKYSLTLLNGKALYIELKIAKGIIKKFLKQVETRKQKQLIEERTIKKRNKINLQTDGKFIFKINENEKQTLCNDFAIWLKSDPKHFSGDYEVNDVAFRNAGTGSIGVKRYVFLIKNVLNKKYFLLDMKQALPSSLKPFLKIQQPDFTTESERVVMIQKRMQNVSPALLHSARFNSADYVLKEMQPIADKINFLVIKEKYNDLCRVVEDMAMLTASAQLRSSGRQGSATADELIDFGKDTNNHNFVLDYAIAYSEKIKSYYLEFLKDYKAGYFKQ